MAKRVTFLSSVQVALLLAVLVSVSGGKPGAGVLNFIMNTAVVLFKELREVLWSTVRSHLAVRRLEDTFADATGQDGLGVCVICWEDLRLADGAGASAGAGAVRRLHCRHAFHRRCLKSWFSKQQNCPTCRYYLLYLILRGGGGKSWLCQVKMFH